LLLLLLKSAGLAAAALHFQLQLKRQQRTPLQLVAAGCCRQVLVKLLHLLRLAQAAAAAAAAAAVVSYALAWLPTSLPALSI
jgi:hypothetical protein